MRKTLAIGAMAAGAAVLIGLSAASAGTATPAPPKPGGSLLQCMSKFTEHEVSDYAADGWSDSRTPEQLAAAWAPTSTLGLAAVVPARVHSTDDVVQLAYTDQGRIVTVLTFSRSPNGWQRDYLDQCSPEGGA